MQPETLYKGHTIVPFCSEGPRYKAHYKLTPPGGVGSQWTYLTAEYTTEVAALEAALAAAKKVVDKGLPPRASRGPRAHRQANASRDHRMFFFVRSKNGAKSESSATRPLSVIGPCTVFRGMKIRSPVFTRLYSSPTRNPHSPSRTSTTSS